MTPDQIEQLCAEAEAEMSPELSGQHEFSCVEDFISQLTALVREQAKRIAALKDAGD